MYAGVLSGTEARMILQGKDIRLYFFDLMLLGIPGRST